jgi:hypothetical protein
MNLSKYVLLLVLALPACERDAIEQVPAPPQQAAAIGEPAVYAPKLIRNDGAYDMIAMIEGVDANQRFIANLRIVESQRSEIRKKRAEAPEGTDFASEEFKNSAFGKELAELEQKLLNNAELMAKNYGYQTGRDYLLMPIECDLFTEEPLEGRKSKILVREIRSGEAYERLHDLRTRFAQAEKEGDAQEAARIASTLARDFSFDVGAKYTMEIKKSLLYRKVS